MSAVIIAGCGKKSASSPKTPEKKKPVIESPVSITADPGRAEVRSVTDLSRVLYKVRWKKAMLNVSDSGPFASSMEGVSGAMFEKGKEANSFVAASATAIKEKNLLKLYGGVDVQSNTYQMKLHCDSLEYLADKKLVVARGHIAAEGQFGAMTGPEEVWATPDLKVIATPKEFKQP